MTESECKISMMLRLCQFLFCHIACAKYKVWYTLSSILAKQEVHFYLYSTVKLSETDSHQHLTESFK